MADGIQHLSVATFMLQVSDVITIVHANALVSNISGSHATRKRSIKRRCSTASYFKMVNGKCVIKNLTHLSLPSQMSSTRSETAAKCDLNFFLYVS